MRLVALNTIYRPCPSGLSDVCGYDEIGSPIVRERVEILKAGDVFDEEDGRAQYLIEKGAAAEDFGHLSDGGDHGEA